MILHRQWSGEGAGGGEAGEVAPGHCAESGGGVGVVFEVIALGGEAGEDKCGHVNGALRFGGEGGG